VRRGLHSRDAAPRTLNAYLVLNTNTERRPAISVFGRDYPTAGGTCIHVADLADAHVLDLKHLAASSRTNHAIYNLGNGTGYSVHQVIDAERAVTGRDLSLVSAERREGDPPVLVASSAKPAPSWAGRPSIGGWPRSCRTPGPGTSSVFLRYLSELRSESR